MAFDSPDDLPAATDFDVLIVGAGISGIDAAYRLQTECPDRRYAILEARDAIGGTWDLFRYPGIRSDSDMSTLGFPFEPWDSDLSIVDGPAIRDYIRNTARKHGIDRQIRFGHRVTRAEWSSDRARWTLRCETAGSVREYTARFLYVGSGYYHYGSGFTPDYPGLANYRGRFVHPQFWPEDLEVAGQNVVVIGSGATAITLVPALAERGARVTMLQRSPTYVVNLPRRDKIATRLRQLLPASAAATLVRWKNILFSVFIYQYARRQPEKMRSQILHLARKQLGAEFDVERHFGPRYKPWDQRLCVVPNGDLFKAIRKGQVEVVTDHIEHFTADGLRTRSGQELPADIVVSATGLVVQLFGGAELFVDGRQIDPSQRLVYRGLMLDGVPNLAFAFGYTNASWTLKCDLAALWVCRLLKRLHERGDDYAVPERAAGDEAEPMLDLDSGYIQRARAVMPLQGRRAPWRVNQNYLRDLASLRLGRIEDGVMQFRRATAAAGTSR